MKFGELLEQAARSDWAANYVNYKVVGCLSEHIYDHTFFYVIACNYIHM